METCNANQTIKPKRGPGRPIDLSKRRAILNAAEELFIKHGLNGTTMDHIARKAEVSKLTVYNHFGTKDNLFSTVIHRKCENHMSPSLSNELSGDNPQEELVKIGSAFMDIIYSQEALGIYRIIVQESVHNKKIAELYSENGLANVRNFIINYFEKLEKKHDIIFENKRRTLGIFLSLFKGYRFVKTLLGLAERLSPSEQKEFCEENVKLFLKMYGIQLKGTHHISSNSE